MNSPPWCGGCPTARPPVRPPDRPTNGQDRTTLTNIKYVTLNVTDQDRALRFCTEQLGPEKRVDYTGPDGRFLTVGVPGGPVEIVLCPQAGGAVGGGAGRRVDGLARRHVDDCRAGSGG